MKQATTGINWVLKEFGALTPHELYAILQLRNQVFVVEQNCVFQDADNKDQLSYHLAGWDNGELVGYTRIVPPGTAYAEASIGRVVTSSGNRRSGTGKELMKESIARLFNLFGPCAIRIGAQLYLKDFYSSFGFQQTGAVYQEDGIDHIVMIRSS